MCIRDSANIMHPLETIDAVRDAENLNNELMLADLLIIEKRLERIDKDAKKTNYQDLEKAVLLQFKDLLYGGTPVRNMEISPQDDHVIIGFRFLTQKSLIILVNTSENDLGKENTIIGKLKTLTSPPFTQVIAMSAKIESEMAHLS